MQNRNNNCNSYDIVGDIAIIRLPSMHEESEKLAEAIMSVHRNVRTVLTQTGPVKGDLRLRELRHVFGEKRTVACHREFGCVFSVDVEKCYFSPRLSYERMRIARQVNEGEIVVNMFAGVGCFSILIAKHANVEKVYSIDVNPVAVDYMWENVRINRVYGKVVPMLGDAKEVVEGRLVHVADRVIMPLPEKAFEYLPCALFSLKKTGGWIHYYGFEYACRGVDAAQKARLKVSARLQGLDVVFQIVRSRIVRSTGPHWWQIVLDVQVSGQGSEMCHGQACSWVSPHGRV